MDISKRIQSFAVNHDLIEKGLYLSRIDGNTKTYDLRFKKPNAGDYFTLEQAHTIEHLAATVLRNSEFSDSVIYFGPMGCRTGFYFIVRDAVSPAQAIELTRNALSFCAEFSGEVPGVSAKECGNWRDHDLEGAKKEAAAMLTVLEKWEEKDLVYPVR